MSDDAVKGVLLLAAIAAVGVGLIVYGSTENASTTVGSVMVAFVVVVMVMKVLP